MARVVALLAVLSWTAAARADAGFYPLPLRYVPVRLTVTVESEPPGVLTFLHDERHGVRRANAGEALEVVYPTGERFNRFSVYAVRAADLARVPGGVPDKAWLEVKENTIGQATQHNYNSGRLDSFDRRTEVTLSYRADVAADGVRLLLVSSNAPPVSSTTMCCALGVLAPVGVAGLGLWAWRRSRRRVPPAA
ncbi:hypothetical protein [Urbifossiella limnaea]|uniref:Uncharacterized protein n=1 Tax=Urbifossiella limnaea TaxID=2528023 RepID=A0A517XQ10_9BACT|nr:hypothetical protein [Urbifossiella limnaea]QDU19583.1 hypothetical protein ETAA1_15130 [Urbifossiella limnaea]